MPEEFLYPITFLPCKNLNEMQQFYEGILKLPIALEQGQCILFKVGIKQHISYWGFCSHYDEFLYPPQRVCLTLVVENSKQVNEWYHELLKQNVKCFRKPEYTKQFKIYNTFFKDPMGYTIEIQAFDSDAKPLFAD